MLQRQNERVLKVLFWTILKCKTCGHGCHCNEDKIDSGHYSPLMDICGCKKCLHEAEKEIEYEETYK